MISRVLGNIARVGVGDVVVVHGGIGFQVFVTPPFASELHKGDDVELAKTKIFGAIGSWSQNGVD